MKTPDDYSRLLDSPDRKRIVFFVSDELGTPALTSVGDCGQPQDFLDTVSALLSPDVVRYVEWHDSLLHSTGGLLEYSWSFPSMIEDADVYPIYMSAFGHLDAP